MTERSAVGVAPSHHVSVATPPVVPARSRWVAPVVLAVVPVVVLAVLRVSPYFRQNNGDPFIYVGYSNDFYAHTRRFGYTYHGVRFGLIFPLRASLWFGPVWGYFILRYLLYQLAIVPLYLVMRPFGRRMAIAAAVLFVATPVAAESIFTTYSDTINVPVLTAILCLLVLATRTNGWRAPALVGASGVLAGVAVNANVIAVALVSISFAAYAAVQIWERRWLGLLRSAAVYAAGVGAVCLAGILVYLVIFDDPGIYVPTFAAAHGAASGINFRSPSPIWLTTRRFVYPPVMALVVGLLVLRRAVSVDRRLRVTFWMSFIVTAGMVAFFAAEEFLFNGAAMEQGYYYSVVIGPTILLLAATVALLPAGRRWWEWSIVVVPVVLAYVSQLFEIGPFVLFVVIVALLVTGASRVRSRPLLLAASFAAMSLAWGAVPRHIAPIAGATFQFEPHYEEAFGDGDDTAFEVYMLATKLTHIVPTTDDVQPPLMFWYRTGDAMLDSVQATWLWQATTVQQTAPGMPVLAPDDPSRLALAVGGFVVMLARTAPELDAAVASLREAGYVVDPPPQPTMLAYDDSRMYVLVVRLLSAPLS